MDVLRLCGARRTLGILRDRTDSFTTRRYQQRCGSASQSLL